MNAASPRTGLSSLPVQAQASIAAAIGQNQRTSHANWQGCVWQFQNPVSRPPSPHAGSDAKHAARGQRRGRPHGDLVIDIRTGETSSRVRPRGVFTERYEVVALPGVERPTALRFRNDEVQRIISVGAWARTGEGEQQSAANH